jgi:Mn2+/Fe2+ NRAMP family transporter
LGRRGYGRDSGDRSTRRDNRGLSAAFIIIATGATLLTHGIHSGDSASQPARALGPFAGRYAEGLFGIGPLGASLLAAAILPIATSYVVSESLDFEQGLGRRPGEAPVFVSIITAMILVATIVAVIPGIPVFSLLVGVQVVNGVPMPINLYFSWRLARSRKIMGEQRNRGVFDGLAGITVAFTPTLRSSPLSSRSSGSRSLLPRIPRTTTGNEGRRRSDP